MDKSSIQYHKYIPIITPALWPALCKFALKLKKIVPQLRFPGMTDLSWLLSSFNQQADNLSNLLGLFTCQYFAGMTKTLDNFLT